MSCLFAYTGTMKMQVLHALKKLVWENCFSKRFGRFNFSIGNVIKKIQVSKKVCSDLHACSQATYLVDLKVSTYLNTNLLSISLDR